MNIQWHHLPITDNHCPDSRFKKEWLKIKDEILQSLNKGEKILIHCRGGQGRAGTIAAEILINFRKRVLSNRGIEFDEAIKQVKQIASLRLEELKIKFF